MTSLSKGLYFPSQSSQFWKILWNKERRKDFLPLFLFKRPTLVSFFSSLSLANQFTFPPIIFPSIHFPTHPKFLPYEAPYDLYCNAFHQTGPPYDLYCKYTSPFKLNSSLNSYISVYSFWSLSFQVVFSRYFPIFSSLIMPIVFYLQNPNCFLIRFIPP